MVANKKKTVYNTSETFKSISQAITAVAVVILLVVFPLYTHDYYFDILGVRYAFFKVVVFVLFILQILLLILYFIIDTGENNIEGSAYARFVNSIKLENFHKNMLVTDYFAIAMLFVCAISTAMSIKPIEAFYGNAGRYQGFESWILYIMLYFIVTRTYKFKKWHIDLAVLAGMAVCIWGITDYFFLNIFGFFNDVQESQWIQFASSIGNLNTYTNYTTIIFALCATLFMTEKNNFKKVFYFITTFISVVASVFGLSDNVLLAFAIYFIVAPIFLIKTKRHLVDFFFLLFALFLGINMMYYAKFLNIRYNTYESIFRHLVEFNFIRIIAYVMLAVSIILLIIYRNKKNIVNDKIENVNVLEQKVSKYFLRTYFALIVIGFLVVVFILVDVNVLHNFDYIWNTLPFKNQLVFNDDWGTHRGQNWRIAFTIFGNQPFEKQLFGVGPDTYLVYTQRGFHEEMMKYHEVYDSAHNEYIQYLVCQGILGLISYLGLFIGGIVYAVKVSKKNIIYFIFVMSTAVYMLQAIVNIAIPITTPVFFTLMYMGIAVYKEDKEIAKSI